MELHKVSIRMTLVLVTPDGHEPTDKEIAKALKEEICTNGFLNPGRMKATMITRGREIPDGWVNSIPWPTRKGLNPDELTVSLILQE